jgi:hypothetical protein
MVVKVFDAVVAMTQRRAGHGQRSAGKFIMDYLFGRANIGLASAASIVLLPLCWPSSPRCTLCAIAAPHWGHDGTSCETR